MDLRAGQLEAMEHLAEGHDTVAVMPTGYGKSAIYLVPTRALDAMTVVVSPLIALQHDQLEHAAEVPGLAAAAVNSAQSAGEQEAAWERMAAPGARLLFLSPEQLAREDVAARLAACGPRLLVVDEAHCVSAWGHDFRPEYLRIGDALDPLGRPVVVALTATASPPVRREIAERLRMRDPRVVVRGFDRPNLRLEVNRFVDDAAKREAVFLRAAAEAKPGLVYTGTRRETGEYADALSELGLRAAAYHAGLSAARRREVHEAFLAGELDVVVATSAFGMGIDKPDVRFVLHAGVPDSPDTYYQEIGRAGRDGEPSAAALFYRPEDLALPRFHAGGHAQPDVLRDVSTAVRAAGPVRPGPLAGRLGLSRQKVTRALNVLEQAEAVRAARDGFRAVDPDGDAAADAERGVEVDEARRRIERSRLEMMRGYAEATGCRRMFLLGYFGEELPRPCGNCDTCAAGSAEEALEVEDVGDPDGYPRHSRVRHREWGPGLVLHREPDRITVLFESVGYRTLSLKTVAEHDLLV
jgi:ATP-dependent DNA helicase RecQ